MLTFPNSNPKVLKSMGEKAYTGILHLAPATLSGKNVCHTAVSQGLDCVKYCLNLAGRGGIIKKGESTNKIQECRIRRTNLFFEDRDIFFALLIKDIKKIIREAYDHDMIPAIRLNGTSDIPWERIIVAKTGKNIFAYFPDVQFYDYTKDVQRMMNYLHGNMPGNYHLTYSFNEKTEKAFVDLLVNNGVNVAVVFRKMLPETFLNHKVINADLSDARFNDPSGVIAGLKAKGPAKKAITASIIG